MKHKILKRKGKNTQPESSFRREHKGLLRRISAFVIAAAVMTTGMPMQQIADNMPDLDIISKISSLIPDAAMKAAAAEPQYRENAKKVSIASGNDLEAYVNGTLTDNGELVGYNEKDTLTITLNESSYTLEGFGGIGTEDHPFAGEVTIGLAAENNPYGEFAKLSWKNSSLFNYVTTDAIITNTNGNDKEKPVYLKTAAEGTAPLFAKHVVQGNKTQTWNIVVDASAQYGGVVGDLGDGAKADIHVGYLNNSAVVGGDTAGGICGSMGKNSELNLWLDESIKDTSGKDTASKSLGSVSANKFAGGVIGQMNTGAVLAINKMPEITGGRTITATDGNSGNAAGGLVGKANAGAKVELADNVTYVDSADGKITVTGAPTLSSAGGVFGYYGVAAGDTVDIDLSRYKVSGSKTLSANADGGFIGRIMLSGKDNSGKAAVVTIDGKTAKTANDDPDFTITTEAGTAGGVVGKIFSDEKNCLENTVIIKNVKTDITANNGNGGGIVGDLGYFKNIKGRTYLKIDGTNYMTVNKGTNSSGSSGIAFSVYSSFLDIGGENTIKGDVDAGVVDKVVDCNNNGKDTYYGSVVRFSGKTDISSAAVKTALLVNLQTDGGTDEGLIYALGSGSDYDSATKKGWTYIRPSSETNRVEDVAPWGQVIRLIGGKTIEEAGVVEYDENAHTVTLKGLTAENNEYKIANTVDLMKLALCIQHNTATKSGAFTTSGCDKSASILKNKITLTGDVDLSGTGLRGLTRDDGGNNAFTGTLDGGNHKITLAIGEAYGYRGEALAKNEAGKDNGNTGAVYDHKYQGLFAKISGATIKDLTFDGSICIDANADDIYGGAVAAQFSGNTKAENVKSDVNIIMRKGEQRIDVGTIFGVDSAENTTVTLKDCTSKFNMTLAGNANSSYNGVSAGTIGHVKNSGSNVTVNGMTISGKLANSIALKKDGDKTYYFYGYGGLIGVVEHQSTKHEIKLNNVNVSNFNITDNSDNNGTGGLLGGSWNNVNVTIGDDSTHDNGVTVEGSKIIVENSASKTIGGLVTSSYGYWQVNSLKYSNSSITGSSSSVVGLIVGKGYEDRTLPNITETNNAEINNAVEPKRLYLEITDPNAYDCAGMTYTGTAGTYDEIVGRTMKERDDDDIGASGEGFVSIRTSGDVLNMNGEKSNEYKPKTDLGKTQPNPYTRYYYNLDCLRAKTSQTGGEKATLWSAYTYAAKNIRDDYFSKYSTFPTEETDIDLTGLSYYPVDVSNTIARNKVTFKLYNEQIQTAHGTKYSTRAYSQHYLMQCGLFRNVTKNITLTNCTISGTAAAYRNSLASATEKLNVQGSGALICGNLEGSSTQKAALTINGLTLNKLTIDDLDETANMALLVRNIGSYTETKISGVSTSGYADNKKAASALIGTAGSGEVLQMTIQFSDMRLDGRKLTSDVNVDAQTAFEKSYKTKSSIFTKATLIHTLQYTSEGGSSAIYNYNYDEDWADDGSAKHNVTYGKEISHSAEFAPDAGDNDQRRYLDKHAADDKNHFTSPEDPKATATAVTSSASGVKGGFDFSSFLPYVATGYDASKQYHELAVNHVSKEMGDGCGTYNDPFIINDGTTLSMVAEILSSGTFSKGFSMYIDNDYLNAATKDKNFEKWDSDKAKGTGHTRIGFDGSNFVAMKKSGNEWVEDTDKSISIKKADVCSYLAGAYYLVEGNDENGGTITLSEEFAGLGQTGSDYAFRGVIAGKKYNGKKMVIKNPSDKPFVSVSNGCVVKDLDIKVTAKTITLTNGKNGADGQLTYGNGTPVYGAVIGKILGGDNIIDGVSVAFSNTKIQLKTADNTANYYKYTTVIPVGGYVGAVVNGGLVFRNMGSEKISPLSKDNFKIYKNTNTATSDNVENYLYVNQIVGRVVNAYCFNEAGSYSIASKTLDNSDKNYPIPDLNPDSDSKISFKQEKGKDKTTMVVPDSQSLFVLSEITQSMCGNAGTDGRYTVKNSYGGENKTTHLAKYSAVGTDNTTQPSDFTLAKEDSADKADAVPYIIRQYTAADENGSYPARAITGSGNYHYMELAQNAKYDLPNCFRGIGQLYPQEMEESKICKNILALYGLDGKGSTVNLNTSLKNHSSEWDCYYKNYLKEGSTNADKIGLGLFNDLYFDVKAKTDDGRKEKSNSIHDLTLSGKLTQEQLNNSGKIKMTSDTNKAANTGGMIGSLRYTASDIDNNSREYNFWNVSLNGLTISGERVTGGFIGNVPDKSLSIYINECSANNLSVKGTLIAAGGVIGYMLGNANLYINTLTEETSEFNESVTSDNSSKGKTLVDTNCGGIIGQLGDKTANANSEVIIRNVTVTAPESKHMGNEAENTNSALNGVGGAIGLANAEGSYEKIKILLINFNLDKVDLYGKNVGGLIGNAKYKLTVRAYNCNVGGNGNSKLSGIEHVGGLFGYFPANGTGSIDGYSNHIDGCSVSGYTISQTSSAITNGAGGLIGTNNYSRNICNSKVENCVIKGGSVTGTGGIIGSCGTNVNVNAYNIVVNGVTLSGSSYYGLFSGYSGGKTFKIVGWSVQGDNTKADKVFGTANNITTVIPADYNGACLDESTRGKNLSDITKATNISRVNTSDDNFPYVTSSPAKNVGTGAKFLTGDGTSADAVEKIIAECEDKTNLKHYTYTNIKNDISNYNQLTFSTEQDILKDIPVILIDNTKDIKDQINSYLSILTNNTIPNASDVKVYKANISGDDVTLSTDGLTVYCNVTDKKFTQFQAKSDKFDSDTRGQFTLIDVQYTDPTKSTSNIVYHVYVPVMTRKIYQYDFYTTAFSGTQYYPSKYTNETGNKGFNGSNPKVLVENYDTPVTAYLRWAYPADTFIKDIMGGSSGLDWNYNKVLNLNVNIGGAEKTIPKGTRFVLIDKNNKNKEYYYTITGKEKYNGEILQLPFSDFTDSSGKAFSEATFADMVSSQLEFTKTTKADGLFVEDEEGNMTVTIDGKKTTIRTANDGETDRFDLSTDTKNLTEDYYLTMTTAKAENVLFHQFQLTSPSSLYPNVSGKINGAVQKNHSVQLNFADLFSNTIKVETLESNPNVVMDDEKNDVNIKVISTISFKENAPISIMKTVLDNNNIPIYHSNHIFMNKRSTNNGAAEKVIGDIDGIEMIKSANTIAAYDSTGTELASPSKLEYNTVYGKASANFFEISEQNNEEAIDLRPWLTAGKTGVAPVVKIKTTFKIIYKHSGIVTQFPERQKSEETTDIGTYVSARSSLAYDAADTTYSSSVSDTVEDSEKRLYYRNAMNDASLKFNAYHPISSGTPDEDRGDGQTKANDQLGINTFDEETKTSSLIHTNGIYDASQLSALDKKNLNIRWTIELQCKNDSYKYDLKLSDYLNSVTIKDINEQQLAVFDSSEMNGTKLEYSNSRDKFEETDNAGLFDVYIDFDVKTGADLEALENAFYSNYKIVLTASLYEGSAMIDGSAADDYIIYTNAHIDPKFID